MKGAFAARRLEPVTESGTALSVLRHAIQDLGGSADVEPLGGLLGVPDSAVLWAEGAPPFPFGSPEFGELALAEEPEEEDEWLTLLQLPFGTVACRFAYFYKAAVMPRINRRSRI
jgi:hypothetical protein